MNALIDSYVRLSNNRLTINDATVTLPVSGSDKGLLSDLYTELGMNYPKFHKMDELCRLGMVCCELLVRNSGLGEVTDTAHVGLVFSNCASSLDSDRQHVRSISDKQSYFPSPSVFVYTLPNIVLGEIAIRHKWTGENAFFVSAGFDASLMQRYCRVLFEQTHMNHLVCGWLNADAGRLDGLVYWVKKTNFNETSGTGGREHTLASLEEIISKK